MTTKTKTILCVDDEHDILDILSYNLRKEGFEVTTADNGDQAIRMVETLRPDLLILDIMMPDIDGLEVCRRIRTNPIVKDTPIIFLTARTDEVDEIIGLDFGADDYVTKPFSPRKVISRIKAVFRRAETKKEAIDARRSTIRIAGIEINGLNYTVTVDHTAVRFLRREFELLFFLMNRPGMVFSRNDLLHHVWGEDAYFVDRTVDVHITKIRKKLGPYGDLVETVRGVGYRFSTNHGR